jgi:hypothetical protein
MLVLKMVKRDFFQVEVREVKGLVEVVLNLIE